jgi:hypothetical protein
MVCPELTQRNTTSDRVNLDEYRWLHQDGRRLIASWFSRAWKMRDCEPENSFEPFIFTWISFNGWAACVTGLDRDRGWLDALMKSQNICHDFVRLVQDKKSPVSGYAQKFWVVVAR